MKISVDRNVVEFRPESAQETESLELLWRVIVDCVRESKKLVPIGEFVPARDNLARFVIEGVPGGKTQWSDLRAPADNTYYCSVCNKYMLVKKDGEIPKCCGRDMETMD